MLRLSEFIIPFKGLSDEVHRFDFDIDGRFFEYLDDTDIRDGDLKVQLDFDKQSRLFTLTFTIHGEVTVSCDRCLSDLKLPVDTLNTLFIRLGDHAEEQSDDVVLIPDTEYQLDVSNFIHEFIVLSLPMRKVHDEGDKGESLCDPEMLRRLDSQREEEEYDPRWEALKKLNLNE